MTERPGPQWQPGQHQQRSITTPTGHSPGYKLRHVQSLPPGGQVMDMVWSEDDQAVCIWNGQRWVCSNAAGFFPWDYAIVLEWAAIVAAGGGVEGQTYNTPGGFTFKVYSKLEDAFADAATRVVSNETLSWSFCLFPGDHKRTGTIQMTLPNVSGISGQPVYLIDGIGPGVNEYDAGLPQMNVRTGKIRFPIRQSGESIPMLHLRGVQMSAVGTNTPSIEYQDGNGGDLVIDHCVLHGKIYAPAGASGDGIVSVRAHYSTLSGATCDPRRFHIESCRIGGTWDFRQASTAVNTVEGTLFKANSADTNTLQILLGKSRVFEFDGNFVDRPASGSAEWPLIRYRGDEATSGGAFQTDYYKITDNIIAFNASATEMNAEKALIDFDVQTDTVDLDRIHVTGNILVGEMAATVNADVCFLRLIGSAGAKIRRAIVWGNTFWADDDGGGDGSSIEDRGGFSVIGDHVERSIFGPNGPAGVPKYLITNGVNNIFSPASSLATGSSGSTAGEPTRIIDADGDTYDDVEVTADSDTLEAATAGVIRRRLSALGMQLANATDLLFYNDAFTTLKAHIEGATGQAAFGSAVANNDYFLIHGQFTPPDADESALFYIGPTWDLSNIGLANPHRGFYSVPTIKRIDGATITGQVRAAQFGLLIDDESGGTTFSDVSAFDMTIALLGAPVVTLMRGVQLRDITNIGGSVGTYIALDIPPLAVATTGIGARIQSPLRQVAAAVFGADQAAHASSIVDIVSTTKGMLPPRMTSTQRDAIGSPANLLIVGNTTDTRIDYYNGSAWKPVGDWLKVPWTYVFPSEAALNADVTTGDMQMGHLHHSRDNAETVTDIITEFETAPTGANALIQFEYADGEDLDVIAVWTEIDLVTHTAGQKTVKTTSGFTNGSIPANRSIRMNIDQVGSTVAGQNFSGHLMVERPLVV